MKVDLPNISSKTFRLILKTLYTGCELLTKYNVLEVWSAVHQLQIHFLMQHCEDFIVDNVTVETLDLKELTKLIKSDQLDVRSEDFVLSSIYDWVSYGITATSEVQIMDENALANSLVEKAQGANANSDKISHVFNNELKSKEEDQCPLLS
ncbi:kelch-like protein 8 [Biomphalaria pfeifferi]|uniref:Kelch-like protein 8 n=1 Tax=Biomphalaria pfeifferi TaxID=112525 RepID=A0AAD8EVY1_BIOPF|nr:kelch-like protein 8 [Biomphalaria pfeifferi]